MFPKKYSDEKTRVAYENAYNAICDVYESLGLVVARDKMTVFDVAFTYLN